MESGSIITMGQSGGRRMLGDIRDDAKISELESSYRRNRKKEVLRSVIRSQMCVHSEAVYLRENR